MATLRLPLVGGRPSDPIRQKTKTKAKAKTKTVLRRENQQKFAAPACLPLVGLEVVKNSQKGDSAPNIVLP